MKKSSKSAALNPTTSQTAKPSKEETMQNAQPVNSSAAATDSASSAPQGAQAPQARKAPPANPKIRLASMDGSDKPVMSNYVAFEATPGIVYIDFGFIEPALIVALQRATQAGVALPEQINGRMAVRVAVGVDVLQNIHQQMGHVLNTLMENAQQQITTFNQLMQSKDVRREGKAPAVVPAAEMAEA
jgi:hypothetical protein